MLKNNSAAICLSILFLLLLQCNYAPAANISLNKKERDLSVLIREEQYFFPNFFQKEGNFYQDIENFNNEKTLHSCSFTSTHTEIFMTLDDDAFYPTIDCIYGYYTHGRTEIRTNIAVCGTNVKIPNTPTNIGEEYNSPYGLLYNFLSKIYDLSKIRTGFFNALREGEKVRLEVASVDNFSVFYQFRDWDDIVSDQYTVGIKDNEKEYLWDSVTCFVNYSSSLKFNGLSFVTNTEKRLIKKLSITNLKEILSRKGTQLNPHFAVFNLEKASDVSPIN